VPQGTIKKLVSDYGYGYIAGEHGELFFHRSEVQGGAIDSLRKGQTVEYQMGHGKKGPCATNVKVPEESAYSVYD